MKPEKLKLNIPLDGHSHVIGIVSEEEDYRLCWAINKMLKIDLKKSDNIEIKPVNSELVLMFSNFTANNETVPVIKLISNRIPNGFLIKEFKNFDYLLLYSHSVSSNEIENYLKLLKNIPFVRVAAKLDFSKIKNMNLLFWLINLF